MMTAVRAPRLASSAKRAMSLTRRASVKTAISNSTKSVLSAISQMMEPPKYARGAHQVIDLRMASALNVLNQLFALNAALQNA